jgi:hypothetical protein
VWVGAGEVSEFVGRGVVAAVVVAASVVGGAVSGLFLFFR